MEYAQRILCFVCLCITMLIQCNKEQVKINLERTKTMNNATIQAHDNNGKPVVIVWEKIITPSNRLNELVKEGSEVLVNTYGAMELEFARKHPETVADQMFLQPIAPLFKEGPDKVDWQQAQEQLFAHLHSFFTNTDFSQYTSSGEIQWFFFAKNLETNEVLGVMQVISSPQLEVGSVKVAFYGVAPVAHGCGIEKLLMSAIFKVVPEVERIFLHTRITNQTLLSMLSDWGFTPFEGPLPYWADREYLSAKSGVLQKAACQLVE